MIRLFHYLYHLSFALIDCFFYSSWVFLFCFSLVWFGFCYDQWYSIEIWTFWVLYYRVQILFKSYVIASLPWYHSGGRRMVTLINTGFPLDFCWYQGEGLFITVPHVVCIHTGEHSQPHSYLAAVRAQALTWLPLIPPQQKGELKVQSFHVVSTDIEECGGESPNSPLSTYWSHVNEVEAPCYYIERTELLVFAGKTLEERWDHSYFYGIWLE